MKWMKVNDNLVVACRPWKEECSCVSAVTGRSGNKAKIGVAPQNERRHFSDHGEGLESHAACSILPFGPLLRKYKTICFYYMSCYWLLLRDFQARHSTENKKV